MMKTEKELQELKEKVEELNKELRELSKEEFDQVTGGLIIFTSVDTPFTGK